MHGFLEALGFLSRKTAVLVPMIPLWNVDKTSCAGCF